MLEVPFHSKSGLLLLAALLAGSAGAQTVYRIVGADGKITFSDKPPFNAQQGKVEATGLGASAAANNSSLPYDLRQVAAKFPVTLYTANECAPCASARSLLGARGIPYSERTISTHDDAVALQRLAGDASVPMLTIGSQKLKGFSDVEWNQYLDAAGYPATSILPSGYKNLPATPLVAVQKTDTPKPADAAPPAPAVNSAPPAAPSANNPSDIQF